MRNTFTLIALTFLLFGCNAKQDKEARLHKLETEILKANQDIRELRGKVYMLEKSMAKQEFEALLRQLLGGNAEQIIQELGNFKLSTIRVNGQILSLPEFYKILEKLNMGLMYFINGGKLFLKNLDLNSKY